MRPVYGLTPQMLEQLKVTFPKGFALVTVNHDPLIIDGDPEVLAAIFNPENNTGLHALGKIIEIGQKP